MDFRVSRPTVMRSPSVSSLLSKFWRTVLRESRGTLKARLQLGGNQDDSNVLSEQSSITRNVFCVFFVLFLKHARFSSRMTEESDFSAFEERHALVTAMEHWNAFTSPQNRETIGATGFGKALFAWIDRLAFTADPAEYVELLSSAYARVTKSIQGVMRLKRLADPVEEGVRDSVGEQKRSGDGCEKGSYLASLGLSQLANFSAVDSGAVAAHRVSVDLVDQNRAKQRAAQRELADTRPTGERSVVSGPEERATRFERKPRAAMHVCERKVAFTASRAPEKMGWDGGEGLSQVILRREAALVSRSVRLGLTASLPARTIPLEELSIGKAPHT